MSTDSHRRSPAGFGSYVTAMEQAGAPLLGHLVLYSVFSGEVTPGQCTAWFGELGLDESFCPGDIAASDVYERVTGPAGVKLTYDIGGRQQTRWERRRDGAAERKATLMIRHVSRGPERIVRHLVREVRDERNTRLSYDPCLAVITFERDQAHGAAATAGSLTIRPDAAAISVLPAAEQAYVSQVLAEVGESFSRGRLYLSGDKLRAVVRDYIESFAPVRVRPGGGVYFVGRQHAATLAALRELVSRFGAGSSLTRVPIPDEGEMRDMVIAAFVTRADTELQKLAAEISRAQASEANAATVKGLVDRFAELKKAAAEHEAVLAGSIGDTQASMQLVEMQLTTLMISAG